LNIFDFDKGIIENYRSFARGFTPVAATDIREYLDSQYDSGHFWPDALIQLNPRFGPGKTIRQLVDAGILHPRCAEIFVSHESGESLRLYKHQEDAVGFAANSQPYVVTSGTGSGKSLTYFVPIVDAIVKDSASHKRTRAIVIYPMNALANSQREALSRFLGEYGPISRFDTLRRYD
jgi:ATP-dependent helicase YprA (DUF1998 family)